VLTFKLRTKFLFLAAGALTAWCLGAPAAHAQSLTGWWLDQSGRAGILISPCGGSTLCGSIDWLRTPLNAVGQKKTDIHNTNAALRPRLLCRCV